MIRSITFTLSLLFVVLYSIFHIFFLSALFDPPYLLLIITLLSGLAVKQAQKIYFNLSFLYMVLGVIVYALIELNNKQLVLDKIASITYIFLIVGIIHLIFSKDD